MKKFVNKFIKTYFNKNIYFAIFIALLIILLITRFYGLETKSQFGYDQVDNAWAVKNIIVDNNLPTVGMQAKGNTGFFIGPYYYYFLVPFYFLTDLDPIASGIAAGVAAIFSLLVTYFVTRGIFNEKVALIATFISVFSIYILDLDRVQWPVNFVVPVSFLIIYSLYKLVNGKMWYLLLLAVSFGFSLHIHFTSIFYLILIIFCIPLIPRNKISFRLIAYSLLLFLLFVFPIILNYFVSGSGNNATSYLSSTFHGFHLRRFLQIIGDGFIEFNAILNIIYALYLSLISFLLFLYLLFRNKKIKKNIFLVYIFVLWVLVPWIAFSTYSGEITNYYFAITRPIAIFTFSYLIYKVILLHKIYWNMFLIIVMGIYLYTGISYFLNKKSVGLAEYRQGVLDKISRGEKVEFVQGDPNSFLYYFYTEHHSKK